MAESKSSPEKGSKLPAIIPASKTTVIPVNEKNGIVRALAVFAPLVVEVIYGITRKWLAETTARKPVSGIEKMQFVKKEGNQPSQTAGYRHRYRSSKK